MLIKIIVVLTKCIHKHTKHVGKRTNHQNLQKLTFQDYANTNTHTHTDKQIQGVSKKGYTFDLDFLKDGSIKLIVLLIMLFSIAIQFYRVQF